MSSSALASVSAYQRIPNGGEGDQSLVEEKNFNSHARDGEMQRVTVQGRNAILFSLPFENIASH